MVAIKKHAKVAQPILFSANKTSNAVAKQEGFIEQTVCHFYESKNKLLQLAAEESGITIETANSFRHVITASDPFIKSNDI